MSLPIVSGKHSRYSTFHNNTNRRNVDTVHFCLRASSEASPEVTNARNQSDSATVQSIHQQHVKLQEIRRKLLSGNTQIMQSGVGELLKVVSSMTHFQDF